MDKKDLMDKLDAMFFPKSLAIIGASNVPGKWGFLIINSILGKGYKGKIFPVNPKQEIILGLKAYPRLDAIPEDIDLAILIIPARLIPDALRDCIARDIHAAVIITSGFKEAGEVGAALEEEITEIARQGDLVFIGPNTMGIASEYNNLEAIPAPMGANQGGLGIISQSGNLGLQIMQWFAHKEIGLSFYSGTGNEALLKANDLLAYFGYRDEVTAIAMYIEGIENGREFKEIARQVTKKKPVIALKSGRSQRGSKAAQSHTGSMAGSFAIYSAMFKQTGIIQVRTPSELLNIAGAMAHLPVPRSNRVGIMSLGGGWGIIAADECEDAGLVLPKLPDDIIKDLDTHLPEYWNRSNPIDIVGESDPDMYIYIMEVLARWDEVDSIIALGIVGRSGYLQDFIECQEKIDGKLFSRELKLSLLKDQLKSERRVITEMARLQDQTNKPIIVVSLAEGGLSIEDTEYGRSLSLSTPEEAVNIIAHMVHYRAYLDHP